VPALHHPLRWPLHGLRVVDHANLVRHALLHLDVDLEPAHPLVLHREFHQFVVKQHAHLTLEFDFLLDFIEEHVCNKFQRSRVVEVGLHLLHLRLEYRVLLSVEQENVVRYQVERGPQRARIVHETRYTALPHARNRSKVLLVLCVSARIGQVGRTHFFYHEVVFGLGSLSIRTDDIFGLVHC